MALTGLLPNIRACQQGSLGKIVGILLPSSEAKKIPELHRRSPRGLASHVVMGTVSYKRNPEATVSEFKEGRYAVCQPGMEICLPPYLQLEDVSRGEKYLFSMKKSRSPSWKSKWCHFFSTYTEPWMNYLLQCRGVMGHILLGGALCTWRHSIEMHQFLLPPRLQTDFLETLEYLSRPPSLPCFPDFSSPVENLSRPIHYTHFISSFIPVLKTNSFSPQF